MRLLWFPFPRRDREAVAMAGGPWGCWLCQGPASHLWQPVGALQEVSGLSSLVTAKHRQPDSAA